MTDISQDTILVQLDNLVNSVEANIVPSYLQGSDRDNMAIEVIERLRLLLIFYQEELDEETVKRIFDQVLVPIVDSYQKYRLNASREISFHIKLDSVCRHLSQPKWDNVWTQAIVNHNRTYWSELYYGDSPMVKNSLVICG
ncbi:MAG: hypothetical protein M0R77_10570 [Gammaproteobacteria bacterium]|nr:hypothetical protein [Gammaproteobacteria bacterium]